MKDDLKHIILDATGASDIEKTVIIQNLWSGYGEILRCHIKNSVFPSVVLKHVQLNQEGMHPRGWNSDLSHRRKLKSYQIETAWYKDWSSDCPQSCRIPRCLALENLNGETVMVMEDLNASGFSLRKTSVTLKEMDGCIDWLASFHAAHLGCKPEGLWQTGTYWHLETRPDELRALNDSSLKSAAVQIDRKLKESPFQTIVHGDAKLANFCFSDDGATVAAVDFQYVGGGIGMKDLAYFIGSCLYEDDCEAYETALLDSYFEKLKAYVTKRKEKDNSISWVDTEDLEDNWRRLFPMAWSDFHRFLKGWSPGHWKINSYSERMVQKVIKELETDS